MDKIVIDLGNVIRPAILEGVPLGTRRSLTKALYVVLEKAAYIVEERFGGPIFPRYRGCEINPKTCCTKTGRRYRVLEYLWDFSFSRFSITQAILQEADADPIGDGRFELLFVAESELGSSHEVCRDLLKLLEARTSIRCLIFRQPSHHKAREKFRARMLRVLHNHAHFRPSPGIWLFVALTWREKKIECELYTLNGTLDALIPVPAA